MAADAAPAAAAPPPLPSPRSSISLPPIPVSASAVPAALASPPLTPSSPSTLLRSLGCKFAYRGVISMAKKSVGDLTAADLKGKKVFVRSDLNVPLNDSQNITDDTRVRAAIPTIKYLSQNGAKVILSSHLVPIPMLFLSLIPFTCVADLTDILSSST
ncbi:hypothetical protein MLD38_038017 [Melastoma candidum]|uniref:Uncharacterized protein n=1 Tax=Melastoma candidum TaxID=119954 RepID=A0ACB9KYQ4_9MYRT|nr:hypothetical protein MLD38_038017 [Melastoma candidum]